jgi:hypothetical protein
MCIKLDIYIFVLFTIKRTKFIKNFNRSCDTLIKISKLIVMPS